MTIKQQGGIFGRNPTFNDVTIEGTLTTSGAQSFEELNVDNINIDGNTISSTDTNGAIKVLPDGTGGIALGDGNPSVKAHVFGPSFSWGGGRAPFWITDTSSYASGVGGGVAFLGEYNSAGNSTVFGSIQSEKENGTDGQYGANLTFMAMPNGGSYNVNYKQMVLGNNGNLTLNTGNLVIGTAGKGIDFSATSGTGTSELFDDYEEGTWTPTLTTDGTDFDSVSYNAITAGRYTKVGNLVHIQCRLLTSAVTVGSASGYVQIGGLPFTSVSNSAGTDDGTSAISIAGVSGFAGEQPSAGNVAANSTKSYLLYRTAADGSPALTVISDVGSGNNIYFSATYISA
jgi:hypothetical protein